MSQRPRKDDGANPPDFDSEFFPGSSKPPFELCDLDFLWNSQFVIGVPASFPDRFKKMVFAAGITYILGNKSIDHVLKKYGEAWNFSGRDSEHRKLFGELVEFVQSNVKTEIIRFNSIPDKADHH